MTWTFTSRRVPVMPVGSPMPSWSSTTNSCGSTCRISRSMGIETALAASIARRTSSRSIMRFLPGDRDHAARVEAADVGAGHAHVGGADLHARHQLGLLHHALDGLDGGLEVDDDALAQPLGLGLADADHVEAALLGDLGHDGADLVGADVEPDDVAVFLLGQGATLPCVSAHLRHRGQRRRPRAPAGRDRGHAPAVAPRTGGAGVISHGARSAAAAASRRCGRGSAGRSTRRPGSARSAPCAGPGTSSRRAR